MDSSPLGPLLLFSFPTSAILFLFFLALWSQPPFLGSSWALDAKEAFLLVDGDDDEGAAGNDDKGAAENDDDEAAGSVGDAAVNDDE